MAAWTQASSGTPPSCALATTCSSCTEVAPISSARAKKSRCRPNCASKVSTGSGEFSIRLHVVNAISNCWSARARQHGASGGWIKCGYCAEEPLTAASRNSFRHIHGYSGHTLHTVPHYLIWLDQHHHTRHCNLHPTSAFVNSIWVPLSPVGARGGAASYGSTRLRSEPMLARLPIPLPMCHPPTCSREVSRRRVMGCATFGRPAPPAPSAGRGPSSPTSLGGGGACWSPRSRRSP